MKKVFLFLAIATIFPIFVWGQANTSTLTSYGYNSGVSGLYSSYFGIYTGKAATSSSTNNVFFGMYSGLKTTGSENTFIGRSAGFNNTTGGYNTYVGTWAGQNNSSGLRNTFIGNLSGYKNTGSYNVFIGFSAGYNETGSNKLYIDNSSTTLPLIYGDFSTDMIALNGRVGIKTNNPSATLHINQGMLLMTGSSFNGENWNGDVARILVDAGPSTGHNFLRFKNNNGTQVFITSNGKIFCNAIETTEIEVKQNVSFPDYVFEDTYKLMDLEDVSKFIQQNKHLPEIPSAKKIAQNGMKLSEITNSMMKKIEELTLYIIELDKTNKLLEERIKMLEE
ncbi:MAG: hypothetical protein CVU09_03985 [Bacteroidetes bacterium HGW-Bacteroidetes-4]|jgi:hypothetical protein|nr:MAG: hypothetical protein CVU09_03985 [Bacteroidetes bacterium HGW-Bacteroidetes-4]